MVVGHYGCGGVSVAVDGQRRGLVDHWLQPIREIRHRHRRELDAIADVHARADRLCELNVIRQVINVASDVIVQDAWARGQNLLVHGWVYSLANGLVTTGPGRSAGRKKSSGWISHKIVRFVGLMARRLDLENYQLSAAQGAQMKRRSKRAFCVDVWGSVQPAICRLG